MVQLDFFISHDVISRGNVPEIRQKQIWKVYSDLLTEKKSLDELTNSVNAAL